MRVAVYIRGGTYCESDPSGESTHPFPQISDMASDTALENITIGATVFTKGIAFDPEDANPNANKQSRTR